MFEIKYKVTIGDINYGGHMGNEVPLRLFHQVRIDFFNSLGSSELNLAENIGTIQIESFVKYKKESFLGDELIIKIVEVFVEKTSMKIEYEVMNQSKERVVIGNTLLVGYDYGRKKKSRIPLEFVEKIRLI